MGRDARLPVIAMTTAVSVFFIIHVATTRQHLGLVDLVL